MKHCKSEGCGVVLDPKKVRGNYCTPCRNSSQRYGMTVPQREKLLIEQKGLCKLCHQPIAFVGKSQYSACIDHDHLTKKVRGIVCGNCNTWLGYLENRKMNLDAVKAYLSV